MGFVLSGQLSDQLPQRHGSTRRMNVVQTLRDPAARPENTQMKPKVPVLRAGSFPGDGRAGFRPAHIPGLYVGRWQGPGLTAAQRRAGRGACSRKRSRAWRPSGAGAAAPQEPGPSPPLLPRAPLTPQAEESVTGRALASGQRWTARRAAGVNIQQSRLWSACVSGAESKPSLVPLSTAL